MKRGQISPWLHKKSVRKLLIIEPSVTLGATVANPNSETFQMAYDAGGLMTAFTIRRWRARFGSPTVWFSGLYRSLHINLR